MRVGVLEWASCGGAIGAEKLPASIRKEGWAMCRALIESLHAAGHEVVACVLPDLPRNDDWQSVKPLNVELAMRPQWRSTYTTCDITIVVAPESDGLLLELEAWCHVEGIRTTNSDRAFLENTGDKWLTAQSLADYPACMHPHTQLLSQWDSQLGDNEGIMWVVKARDGAGCDGMQRLSTAELKRFQDECLSEQKTGETGASAVRLGSWIVQPWMEGKAYSRTAIVDLAGRFHWLPVVEQHLQVDRSVHYVGGRVCGSLQLSSAQEECLALAVRAMPGLARGWIGVDFLIDADDHVRVIEINPRLTTSFVGLSRAGDASLADLIVRAARGDKVVLPKNWRSVTFGV